MRKQLFSDLSAESAALKVASSLSLTSICFSLKKTSRSVLLTFKVINAGKHPHHSHIVIFCFRLPFAKQIQFPGSVAEDFLPVPAKAAQY